MPASTERRPIDLLRVPRAVLIEDRAVALANAARSVVDSLKAGERVTNEQIELLELWAAHTERACQKPLTW